MNLNRLISTITPNGVITKYDSFGRLAKIISGNDTVIYNYNTKNQIATRTTNGITVRYSYTKFGQLSSKTIAGMEDSASLKYFYDKDGTLSGREVGGVKQTYKYDAIGQLLAVVDSTGKEVEKYVYDPAGNILSKTVAGKTTTYTYDKANQLVSSTNADGKVTKYEYDAAGRMVKEGEKTFAYGWLDKVMQVAENGNIKQSYSYDISGQLATADYGDSKETFLWDGLALLSRNNLKYVNEPAITGGNPILAGDKILFDDMLGNTLGVKDGEKFSAIDRDAFGELKPGENPNLAVNFFTGKPEVDGLGYSFLFRNYRSDLGKWQTADPLGYPDGWNNLAYVNNSVTMNIDWMGGSVFDFLLADSQGVELFNHWLNGSGTKLSKIDDASWSNYMRANKLLYNQVSSKLIDDYNKRTMSGMVYINFHAVIENGYRSGYQMLHGTNGHVGDFVIIGFATVEYDSDEHKIITYDIRETWNDIIDPNSSYWSDIALSVGLGWFYDPKDYDVEISWKRKFVIE